MKRLRITILLISGMLILLFALISAAIAPIATGYPAKYLCSSVFVNKMKPDTVWQYYVEPENPLFKLVDYELDRKRKSVEVKLYGLIFPSKARFEEGCGCTLESENNDQENIQYTRNVTVRNPGLDSVDWPVGYKIARLHGEDLMKREKLELRLKEEFQETIDTPRKNTWAVAVVYKDQLWAESYGKGIDKYTPLLSWSASKSITGTLAGRWFTITDNHWDQVVDLPKSPSGKNHDITWKNLLQMQDGLDFSEVYLPFYDATEMLYSSTNMALFASDRKQVYPPGTNWNYSSGTTNILSWLIKERTGGSKESFEKFAREEFLDVLGIQEAIFEYDESGTFVGSSYFHASPQSWLKVAMLYKNKGNWLGQKLLSEDWIDFALSPASDSKGKYGAQIWLNRKTKATDQQLLSNLPEDTFMFQGYQGQYIVVIPSWDLMVVRMGVMRDPQWKMEQLILEIKNILEN